MELSEASKIILAPKEYRLPDFDHSHLFDMVELEPVLRDRDDKTAILLFISMPVLIFLILNQIVFICLFIRWYSTEVLEPTDWLSTEDDSDVEDVND